MDDDTRPPSVEGVVHPDIRKELAYGTGVFNVRYGHDKDIDKMLKEGKKQYRRGEVL